MAKAAAKGKKQQSKPKVVKQSKAIAKTTKKNAKAEKDDSVSKKISKQVKTAKNQKNEDSKDEKKDNRKVQKTLSKDFEGEEKIKKVTAPKVQAFKYNKDASEPKYPTTYDILKNCVLQITDIKDNHNKYYALELHKANNKFRLFTHYGRTDDLNTNPEAGQKETRYYDSLEQAYAAYQQIYKEKTSNKKGYKPVNLYNSKIGSDLARGKSAGKIQEKTKAVIEESKMEIESNKKKADQAKKAAKKNKQPSLNLAPSIKTFIKYIYDQAVNKLTSSISANITEDGIETPLGILTIEQIEKGEECLDLILKAIKSKKKGDLEKLSSDFYTAIPHQIGRRREDIKAAVINEESQYTEKKDLMQLMKDCLKVSSGDQGNVLFDPDIDSKYRALGCEIKAISKTDKEWKFVDEYIKKNYASSQKEEDNEDGDSGFAFPTIKNIYEISRSDERKAFNKKIGNEQLMFHGTKLAYMVGILTRGILLPQAVTKLGVTRTDFGWLGAGIYFGNVWETSENYCETDVDMKGLMFLVNVALGKVFEQAKTDGAITKPPAKFDSMHGNPELPDSEFDDHEYCIYAQNQQYIKYIVEFAQDF